MTWQTVALLSLEVRVVPEQLVHTAPEGEHDQDEQEHPLHDVKDHFAEGNLQGTEVRVDGQDVDNLEKDVEFFFVGMELLCGMLSM